MLLASFDVTAIFCDSALKNASMTSSIDQWRSLLKARVRDDGEYFEYTL